MAEEAAKPTAEIVKHPAHPVPATRDEFRAKRHVPPPSLNDKIDAYNDILYEDASYRAFLDGVWDDQCVEGSQVGDDYMAASMIRDKAKKSDDSFIGSLKLATIVKSLRVVLRRYGQGRKERRYTVGGETVAPDDDNSAGK